MLPLAGNEEAAPKANRVVAAVDIHQIDERRPVVLVQMHPIPHPVVPLDDRREAVVRRLHPPLDRQPAARAHVERAGVARARVVVDAVKIKGQQRLSLRVAHPAEEFQIVAGDHVARRAIRGPPCDRTVGHFDRAVRGDAHFHEIARAVRAIVRRELQQVKSRRTE